MPVDNASQHGDKGGLGVEDLGIKNKYSISKCFFKLLDYCGV